MVCYLRLMRSQQLLLSRLQSLAILYFLPLAHTIYLKLILAIGTPINVLIAYYLSVVNF